GGGARAMAAVRAWPRKMQIAAGVGLALVLVLVGLVLVNRPDPATRTPLQATPPTTAPTGPAFATQTFADRGVSVNVPQGWERKTGGSYVDFVDPADSGRKVRIIVEPFRRDAPPARWVVAAEKFLQTRSTSCAQPYARVGGVEELDHQGRPAAQFEYTCGTGEGMRHGVWRVVPADGKAYSFYLSTTDAHFDESKPIFEEMVRTFRLTGAG
ncbi:MAG TPA: serine/threonine protein kinase, partial [Micromonosporaceae bacterium]